MGTAMIPAVTPARYQLIARDEHELLAAHKSMVQWAKDKQQECTEEVSEVQTLLDIAIAKGWAFAPYTKRLNMLKRRVQFYAKVEAALHAGYVLVPNFQMTVFAIRTDSSEPKNENSDSRWERFEQSAKLLPIGEGTYVNPFPATLQTEEQVQNASGQGTHTVVTKWLTEFRSIEFPLELAKPMLMEQTSQAMSGRVFDEIGVAVDTMGRRADPIILGRIRNPKRNGIHVSFFIAWYFDPSRI